MQASKLPRGAPNDVLKTYSLYCFRIAASQAGQLDVTFTPITGIRERRTISERALPSLYSSFDLTDIPSVEQALKSTATQQTVMPSRQLLPINWIWEDLWVFFETVVTRELGPLANNVGKDGDVKISPMWVTRV
ncbi:hypothetical protein IW262DRAFT_1302745 [Armillaria fumosa]|nr:hypothetical protein IW262DRAFT_1302745 [Armillaria fumosa]